MSKAILTNPFKLEAVPVCAGSSSLKLLLALSIMRIIRVTGVSPIGRKFGIPGFAAMAACFRLTADRRWHIALELMAGDFQHRFS